MAFQAFGACTTRTILTGMHAQEASAQDNSNRSLLSGTKRPAALVDVHLTRDHRNSMPRSQGSISNSNMEAHLGSQIEQTKGVPHLLRAKNGRYPVPRLSIPQSSLLGVKCMAQLVYATRNNTGNRFEIFTVESGSPRFEETSVTKTKTLL